MPTCGPSTMPDTVHVGMRAFVPDKQHVRMPACRHASMAVGVTACMLNGWHVDMLAV